MSRNTLCLGPGLATVLALLLGAPAMAQDKSGARVMTAAQIAPAAIRQDLIQGAYELLEAREIDTLFVASTPSFDKGTSGFLDLLDPDTLAPIRRIQLPRRAFALGMDHARGKLFVGNTLDGALSVIDAKSGFLIDTVQLGKPEGDGFEHTRMVEVDPESGRVFVSSPTKAGALWIVDPAAGNAVQRIDNAGLWAAGLAFDPASGRLYLSGGGIDEVLVVDGRSGQRIGAFSTGDTTEKGEDASKHFFVNLALDGQGKHLLAADAETGSLYVFDTASGEVVKTVPIGDGTLDVAYGAATDQVFVTYRGASREQPNGTGGLVVLDGKDFAPVASIPLPAHPNSLAVGAEGKSLLLTVKAPHEKEHPLYREDGRDSVLRFDLPKLAEVLGQPQG